MSRRRCPYSGATSRQCGPSMWWPIALRLLSMVAILRLFHERWSATLTSRNWWCKSELAFVCCMSMSNWTTVHSRDPWGRYTIGYRSMGQCVAFVGTKLLRSILKNGGDIAVSLEMRQCFGR